MFASLATMKATWGRGGPAMHVLMYTVLPIAFGFLMLLAPE